MEVSDRLQRLLKHSLDVVEREEKRDIERRRQKERERTQLERSYSYTKMPYYQAWLKFHLRKRYKHELMPGSLGEHKGQIHRRNFISMAWYLIKQETGERKQINIYKWIEDFLSERDFKKRNGQCYTPNDIKGIVYDHCEGMECRINESHLEPFFDHIYSTFQ